MGSQRVGYDWACKHWSKLRLEWAGMTCQRSQAMKRHSHNLKPFSLCCSAPLPSPFSVTSPFSLYINDSAHHGVHCTPGYCALDTQRLDVCSERMLGLYLIWIYKPKVCRPSSLCVDGLLLGPGCGGWGSPEETKFQEDMTPPSMTPLQKEGSPTCSSATQIFLWPLPSSCRTPSSLTTENINTPLGNTGHNSLSVCSSKPGSADLKITLVSQQLILTRIWVNVGGMNGSSFFFFFCCSGSSLLHKGFL